VERRSGGRFCDVSGFTIGKQLIALYLGKVSFASTYGAAGSLVMLLVWVYYSSQLFFLERNSQRSILSAEDRRFPNGLRLFKTVTKLTQRCPILSDKTVIHLASLVSGAVLLLRGKRASFTI